MIAYVGVRLIISIMPPYGIPTEAVIGVNGLALLFALVLSVAAGSASGLAPALRASKSNLSESLSHGEKGGTGSSGRRGTRNALIVSECAVALVLLVSAGLTFRSFLALRTVRLGFDPGRILTMDMPVNWGATAWQERVTVLNAILSRVQTLPGVEAAALSISTEPPPPFQLPPYAGAHRRCAAPGAMNLVSPEFFRTFQVPLIRGRLFTEAEDRGAGGGGKPHHRPGCFGAPTRNRWAVRSTFRPWEVEGVGTPPDLNGWCQVVGVVGDALNDGLQRPTQPGVYIPYSLLVHSETALAVRTASNPLALANAVRSAIASAGNGQPVTNVSRYSDYLADVTLSYDRFNAVLLLLFGALGTALCASGIYSVVWYWSRTATQCKLRHSDGAGKRKGGRYVGW